MNALLSVLNDFSKDVQVILHEKVPSFDASPDSLSWLNVSISFNKLLFKCHYVLIDYYFCYYLC